MEHSNEYNETFGFIDALGGSDENFGIIQSQEIDESQKSLPPLMAEFEQAPLQTADFTSPTNNSVQYQDITSSSPQISSIAQKPEEAFDIQSDPILNQPQEKESAPSNEESKPQEEHKESTLEQKTPKKELVTGKKRKRIVLLNDEDDSDDDTSNLKKEILGNSNEDLSQDPESKSNERDVSVAGNDADDESDEQDDEASTIVNPDALKARFLLKSAIIIKDPRKKKKNRVLESDDEDENEQHLHTSVDDIGLTAETEHEDNENDVDANVDGDIIIFDDPISSDNVAIGDQKTLGQQEGATVEDKEGLKEDVAESSEQKTQKEEEEVVGGEAKAIKIKKEKSEEKETQIKKEPANPEGEDNNIDDVLEKIKPMADDDEFFKYDKSSEDETKKETNEEYFGTPDKSVVSNTGKKRGPKPGTKRGPRTVSETSKSKRKRGNRYEKDFVDDSDSDSSEYSDSLTSYSESSSESSVEEVRPVPQRYRPLPVKKVAPPPTPPTPKPTVMLTKVPAQKNPVKKDRFYDQSRNIPDSVYFGEVKVPLHILHTRWNSSAESSERKINKVVVQEQIPQKKSAFTFTNTPPKSRPQPSYVEPPDDPKLSTLKDLVKITGIKINYTKLFNGVKSTDHKCMMIRRILAQKGLEGEPTVAKCKKLKAFLQAKRESAELDKSVIINEGGRTRRSRNVKPVRYSESDEYLEPPRSSENQIKILQPETLQTLSKIKSVVDSDSE